MAIVEKNGVLYVVLYMGNRKQKWVRVPSKSRRAARTLELELTAKVKSGEFQATKPIAFDAFSEQWMTDYVSVALKPATQQEYAGYLRKYWVPLFGSRKLESIKPADIQRHVALLVREGRLAPKSIRNQVTCLRRLMRTAQEWGYLNSNPVKHVALPASDRREMAYLTPAQMRLLVDTAKDKPLEHAVLALACGTGLRKSELRGLQWSAAELAADHCCVTVRTTVVGNTDKVVATTKSKAGYRTVPLPAFVADALMNWSMVAPDSPQGLVFSRKGDRPLRAEWFNDMLTRNLERAGLPRVRFHDLRHSFCSALISADPVTGGSIPLPVVQRLLGHEDISTTISVYGHLSSEATRMAADRVQDAVFGTLGD